MTVKKMMEITTGYFCRATSTGSSPTKWGRWGEKITSVLNRSWMQAVKPNLINQMCPHSAASPKVINEMYPHSAATQRRYLMVSLESHATWTQPRSPRPTTRCTSSRWTPSRCTSSQWTRASCVPTVYTQGDNYWRFEPRKKPHVHPKYPKVMRGTFTTKQYHRGQHIGPNLYCALK